MADSLVGLLPALRDFEQAPGRYSMALREPHALFEHIHAVLLLAAGRSVEGLEPLKPGAETDAAQRAARFFVRTVLLRQGADHYALLGLQPGFEPTALRDHYRLMIRLTHPDFTASGDIWPADAAARINLANDVLSSSVKRGVYDAALEKAKSVQPVAADASSLKAMPPGRSRPARHTAAPVARHDVSRQRRSRIMQVGAGALVCALGLWLLTPSEREGSLVARSTRPASSGVVPLPAQVADPQTMGVTEKAAEDSSGLWALADEADQGVSITGASPLVERALERSPLQPQSQTLSPPKVVRELPREVVALSREIAPTNEVALQPKPVAAALLPAGGVEGATKEMRIGEGVKPDGNAQAARDGLILIRATSLTLSPQGAAALATTPSAAASVGPPSAGATLTMQQLQPSLGKMLSGLQTGRGENMTRLLSGYWREHPAAATFVKRFDQLLGGVRLTQIGKASFSARTESVYTVVDGVIELQLQGANGEALPSKTLQISAYFLPENSTNSSEAPPQFTRLVVHEFR